MIKKYLFIICLAITSSIQAGDTPPDDQKGTQLDKLLIMIDARLDLMQEVAAYKFANNIEIENKQREAAVIERAMAAAERNGLNPESVKQFFQLQIRLAKRVQRNWFNYWLAEAINLSRDFAIPDLNAEIRPKLISLGDQIIEQIPLALAELHDTRQLSNNFVKVEQGITNGFISPSMKHQLLDALILVRSQPQIETKRLAQIQRRGVLRVGTTGDYKPFSFVEPGTGKLTGVDIELAESLAAALGVELKLVKTSWPTLMNDFVAEQFDIGMSGITDTAPRRQSAFFSEPYLIGGKTPIALCAAKEKLNSLTKIDRAEIRVIVNPGGTNEKYVRKNINNAQIIVHPDNTTIFEQLINKRADVMITDAIEVKVQTAIHPELCGTLPDDGSGELLTHAVKAFLLPQDSVLKEAVDKWLAEMTRSGQLEAIFSRYLSSPNSQHLSSPN